MPSTLLRAAPRATGLEDRRSASSGDDRNRCELLSITRNFGSDYRGQTNVGEPPRTRSHDGIAGRRVIGAREIAAEPRDPCQLAGERSCSRCATILHEGVRHSNFIVFLCETRRCGWGRSVEHRDPEGGQLGMKTQQLGWSDPGPFFNFESSALQPDSRTSWKIAIFHLVPHHRSFSMASLRNRMGRSAISIQSIFVLFLDFPRSSACITSKVRAGYRCCLPIGGRTRSLRYWIPRTRWPGSPSLS